MANFKTTYSIYQEVWFVYKDHISKGRITGITIESKEPYANILALDDCIKKTHIDKITINVKYDVYIFSESNYSRTLLSLEENKLYKSKTSLVSAISQMA
jgi:hypothetical protein